MNINIITGSMLMLSLCTFIYWKCLGSMFYIYMLCFTCVVGHRVTELNRVSESGTYSSFLHTSSICTVDDIYEAIALGEVLFSVSTHVSIPTYTWGVHYNKALL